MKGGGRWCVVFRAVGVWCGSNKGCARAEFRFALALEYKPRQIPRKIRARHVLEGTLLFSLVTQIFTVYFGRGQK